MRSQRFVESSLGVCCIVLLLLGIAKFPMAIGCQTAVAELDSVTVGDQVAWKEQLRADKGSLRILPGTYVFTETLEIDLKDYPSAFIKAEGSVTIEMRGPGPAIRLQGTLTGSADPEQISEETWKERMPVIDGIGILGAHPEADGIELIQTMQVTISRVHVRKARHGVVLRERNRNVVMSDVHLYDNSGVGLFLDEVNLHQFNLSNSHISYNIGGGIVVRGGNVRNLHVTGCDIEANMPRDATPTKSANIFIDCSSGGSVAEVAVTGCTIQHSAHYHPEKNQAPGGANIRIVGRDDYQPNMITITGNVISDTQTHLHLKNVVDTTVTGNTFFTTEPVDVLMEQCQRIVLANNVFNPREATGTGQIQLRNSEQCLLNGLICCNLVAGASAVHLEGCEGIRVSNCMIQGSRNGVELRDSTQCSITDCTFSSLGDDENPVDGFGVIGDLEGNEVRNNLIVPRLRKEEK